METEEKRADIVNVNGLRVCQFSILFQKYLYSFIFLKISHYYFKMATKMHLSEENMRNNIITNQREKAKALHNHKTIRLFSSLN